MPHPHRWCCLPSAALALALTAPFAAAAPAVTATAFFDVVESLLPEWFSPHQADASAAPYTFRCYPTGYCMGVEGQNVVWLGPASAGVLQSAGKLADYTCTVVPAACQAPTAAAGPAQSVALGARVTLDGSASSAADGAALTYAWQITSLPAGSRAVLSDAGSARPSLLADVAGTYRFSLTVSAGTVASAPASVEVSVGARSVASHGKLTRRLSVDGAEREYLVHVPATVDGRRTVPVVFMIHGTSGDGLKFYNISGWVEEANRQGFIAVFPSALAYCLGKDENLSGTITQDEYSVTTKWASGALGGGAMPLCSTSQINALPANVRATVGSTTLRDDVAFFRSMVTDLSARLPVDLQRLYVSGFSNGAEMASRLMLEMSDTFAAFAMAGGGTDLSGHAARPAPFYLSMGSLDENILNKTGALYDLLDNLTQLPLDASFLQVAPVPTVLNAVLDIAQLDAAGPVYTPLTVQGKTMATFAYTRSLVGASNTATVAVIEGATHQYPNGSNHPVVMTELLWPFFSSYALP